MAVRARDHVAGIAGLLSAVSLAIVFAAAFGVVPARAVPRAPADLVAIVPHVNAVISAAAIGVIAAGWRFIRAGRIDRHRVAMVTGVVLFAVFLALYLYKVILEGPAPFPGPRLIYRYVYLPLLAIHVSLAVVCVPLLYYALLLGLTHPIHEIGATHHRRVGRLAAPLWLISFALGIVVYLLLYVAY